ncbi:uncharacterized protein LOC124328585 [Daphnia pulicaria]|uniref:uncharacterized protein LOC124311774 n=1 Tax=Daphnia pulicaria TaxID=35523 RepID=UPI001EEA4A08|nr:uncharacterized protein LOC124311774 [Daphnia pulicaria]XP_046643394.1 uncharacterized protein LOC124328585 [Daphnia pulicaria]
MTFSKYIDDGVFCFIPGKVLDECYRLLREIVVHKNLSCTKSYEHYILNCTHITLPYLIAEPKLIQVKNNNRLVTILWLLLILLGGHALFILNMIFSTNIALTDKKSYGNIIKAMGNLQNFCCNFGEGSHTKRFRAHTSMCCIFLDVLLEQFNMTV